MPDDVPDLIGRRHRATARALVGNLIIVAIAAVVGAALLGALGFWLWATFVPHHGGCGDIGCWDALQGAMIGMAAGAVGTPILALRCLRRRS